MIKLNKENKTIAQNLIKWARNNKIKDCSLGFKLQEVEIKKENKK